MVLRMAEIERLQEICVGGETSIDDEVIGAIAGLATREIDGVCTLGTSSIRRPSPNAWGSRNEGWGCGGAGRGKGGDPRY